MNDTLVDRLKLLDFTSQTISKRMGTIMTNPLIMKDIYQDTIPDYFEKITRGQAPSGEQVIDYLKFKSIKEID